MGSMKNFLWSKYESTPKQPHIFFHIRATPGNCLCSTSVPDSRLMAYIFWPYGPTNVTPPSEDCQLPVNSAEKRCLWFQESLLSRTRGHMVTQECRVNDNVSIRYVYAKISIFAYHLYSDTHCWQYCWYIWHYFNGKSEKFSNIFWLRKLF